MINKTYEIVFESISKNYDSGDGKLHVIDNFSYRIKKNEFSCLLGPSGCGKTTIINILAGYINFDSGRITMNDKDIFESGPDRVVIFQDDAVFPWRTVQQNIEYGLKFKNKNNESYQEKIDDLLSLMDLTIYRKYFPKQLSAGMRRRVEIARAFAIEPKVILMDEPFGSLDALNKEKMQIWISNIYEKYKTTILFVTHDIEEALFLGDTAAIMSEKPSSIKKIINIPFKRSREIGLKRTSEFQEMRWKIKSLF